MKVHCSGFDSYEDYKSTPGSEKHHSFNLKNKKCSCGRTLRYFCETCGSSFTHSTIQKKHRHKDDDRLTGFEFESLFDDSAFGPTPPSAQTNQKISKLRNRIAKLDKEREDLVKELERMSK